MKKNLNMSFNSSDVEAYREESPIPIVKEAYFEYQRNKRKAAIRIDSFGSPIKNNTNIELRNMNMRKN